jgi:uncharacterized protein (TIGR02246 family)
MPPFLESHSPRKVISLLHAFFALAIAAVMPATGRADLASDTKAIQDAGQAYKAALERGDGKALAALWTPDGDIVDAMGNVMKGRDTVSVLEPAAEGDAKPGQPEIAVRETKLRFINADVALEDGTVEVVPPGRTAPLHGRFSATWVRHEGSWKLAALREARGDEASGDETLASLDWMVGDWTAVDEATAGKPAANKAKIEVSARWNPMRTFLLRDMKITPPGAAADAVIQVTQRIGWDPLSKSIRSWVFSSDGGHGEAAWSRDDGSWVARTTAVLPDGSQTSSLNIYTYDGKDKCVWRSLPTHVGGEHMPQVNMTLIRKPGTGTTEGAR